MGRTIYITFLANRIFKFLLVFFCGEVRGGGGGNYLNNRNFVFFLLPFKNRLSKIKGEGNLDNIGYWNSALN